MDTAERLFAVVETAAPLVGEEWQPALTRLLEYASTIHQGDSTRTREMAEVATEDLVALALYLESEAAVDSPAIAGVRATMPDLQRALATLVISG